jgi:hypothetical protein
MKKLVLNNFETYELKKYGQVEIIRNGFLILVEQEPVYEKGEYIIRIMNPYNRIVFTETKAVKE